MQNTYRHLTSLAFGGILELMAAIKILFIVGAIAGIIIIVNTILRANGSDGIFGFLPAGANDTVQQSRPLETVPSLIENNP